MATLCGVGLRLIFFQLRDARSTEPLVKRRVNERAWLLVVNLRFKHADDMNFFLGAFAPMADAVSRSEPATLGYEVSRSEKDPLLVMIYERYASKSEYLDTHKAMKHFLKFRPKLQQLQDAHRVVVSGESFQELGIGFM